MADAAALAAGLPCGLGVMVILVGLGGLVVAWPWQVPELFLVVIWLGYGVFLIWASRSERSGTRLEADAVTVTSGRRVTSLSRADILDLRHDRPGEHAWRVQAVTSDGELITLLGVPPEQLDRLRAWPAWR